MTIWNPWHGCRKYSEGCEHCYMYYLDAQRERDGSEIYRTKTNFNLPLKKTRQGTYKIPAGTMLHVCMTSDFFLEEADAWRVEVWEMIRQRPDILFWLQTKRAERIAAHLPEDWGAGWDNVTLCVTTENQTRADERLPILLDIPARHKAFMIAPILSEVHVEKFLATGQFSQVLCDGENYDGQRPCDFAWVQSLHDQCRDAGVRFDFIGTGSARTERCTISRKPISGYRRSAPDCRIRRGIPAFPCKSAAVPVREDSAAMAVTGAENAETKKEATHEHVPNSAGGKNHRTLCAVSVSFDVLQRIPCDGNAGSLHCRSAGGHRL